MKNNIKMILASASAVLVVGLTGFTVTYASQTTGSTTALQDGDEIEFTNFTKDQLNDYLAQQDEYIMTSDAINEGEDDYAFEVYNPETGEVIKEGAYNSTDEFKDIQSEFSEEYADNFDMS